jgi:hypothetical protein
MLKEVKTRMSKTSEAAKKISGATGYTPGGTLNPRVYHELETQCGHREHHAKVTLKHKRR